MSCPFDGHNGVLILHDLRQFGINDIAGGQAIKVEVVQLAPTRQLINPANRKTGARHLAAISQTLG